MLTDLHGKSVLVYRDDYFLGVRIAIMNVVCEVYIYKM